MVRNHHVETVGNARDFKNGRQFAAWLGLTPLDNTQPAVELDSVAITKRGDIYLRTLLVHGARSELIHTPGRKDTKSRWVENLKHTKSWRHFAQVLNFRFEIRCEPPNL